MMTALDVPAHDISTGSVAIAPADTRTAAGDADDGLSAFLQVRRRLFGIAYRMLGSAAEAEDLVQDAWLRWQTTDRSAVHSAEAFLVTAVTRLAINVLQSARARRETYVGPWLPEPVDTSVDPRLGAERGEALNFAVLVLLEKLTPTERAAYILREAFNHPYREIAAILRIEESNARQLVTRARGHVASERRAPVSPLEQQRLLDAFIAAARSGDLAGLESLLAADVISTSDGGGVVRAARVPVVGRTRVARFVVAVSAHFWSGVTLSRLDANGQPCTLISRDGIAVGLVSVDASPEGITRVRWLMRPSKLAGVAAPWQIARPETSLSAGSDG